MSSYRNGYEAIMDDALYAGVSGKAADVWHDHALRDRPAHEITAIATRISQLADWFEWNPNQRIKGALAHDKGAEYGVCAIGAVMNARKIGLKWDPTASRNCNAKDTVAVMTAFNLVDLNDSMLPAKQYRNYLRTIASVLNNIAARVANGEPCRPELVASEFKKHPNIKRWAKRVGFELEDMFNEHHFV